MHCLAALLCVRVLQYNVTVRGMDDDGEVIEGENMLQLTTPAYVELVDAQPEGPTSGNATADPQPGDAFNFARCSAACWALPVVTVGLFV